GGRGGAASRRSGECQAADRVVGTDWVVCATRGLRVGAVRAVRGIRVIRSIRVVGSSRLVCAAVRALRFVVGAGEAILPRRRIAERCIGYVKRWTSVGCRSGGIRNGVSASPGSSRRQRAAGL